MKYLKSIFTILILVIAVAGMAEYAMAQGKKQTRTCTQCGKHFTQGAGGGTVCPKCVAKNKKKPEPKPKPKKEPQPTPQPKPKVDTRSVSNETFTVNGVSFTMVQVPGGSFTMGASNNDSEAEDWEKPAHNVTLSSYYIGQTEVTQELWEAVMGSNPSRYKGAKRPVENVSWDDCQTFINKLNAKTGKKFRLPTEAEWEYAARGGKSNGCKYSGSNTLSDVAWYTDNSGSTTHDVATKRANELGIYDMSGNVWEWCSDWYDSDYYKNSPSNNPHGPSSGYFRVRRGGCWHYYARLCRVSYRLRNRPDYSDDYLGLRLAL